LSTFLEQAQNADPKSIPPPQYLLQVAARNGQAGVVRYLFDTLTECPNNTPWDPSLPKNLAYDEIPAEWQVYEDGVVHTAIEGTNPIEIFQVFFDYGMSPDYGLGRDGSILVNALSSPQLGNFLLERGADPNNPNCGSPPSKSCLLLAAHNPTPDMINALIEHGANVQGSEALRGAAEARRISNARRLLELGVDVNEVFTKVDYDEPEPPYRSPCGYALHFAVKGSMLNFVNGDSPAEMVRFLLEKGARTNVLDDEGKKPLEIAKEAGQNDIVQVLEDHEAKIKPRLA
jgi:ankyrin repeat protein